MRGTGTSAAADITGPSANLNQTGASLNMYAPIAVVFSESMDIASLQLGGTLASEADGGVWSSTNATNDTLTISPQLGYWSVNTTRTLTLDARDLAGNPVATVNASYLITPPLFNNFQNADVVIGQPDFTTTGFNQSGGPGANTLTFPLGNPLVASDGKLFLSDPYNNRVLVFNSVPTTNNASADYVLGQADFSSSGYVFSQTSQLAPTQVVSTGGKMIVTNRDGHRVLIHNTLETSGPGSADVVVGQPDFFTGIAECDADSLWFYPEAATVTPDGKLIISDTNNNRVLIWNSLPSTNGQPADIVLGQASFTRCARNDDDQDGAPDPAPTARTLYNPSGLWTDGTRLVVGDRSNHRVLIWNQIPAASFQPADLVLGQASFTTGAANDDNQNGVPDATPSARTLHNPSSGIHSNGIQLAVADTDNHRVLIWNTFPTVSFQPADVVLGQSDFVHSTNNDNDQNYADDSVSARVLYSPSGVLFHKNKLFIADRSNNRVLIFQAN